MKKKKKSFAARLGAYELVLFSQDPKKSLELLENSLNAIEMKLV